MVNARLDPLTSVLRRVALAALLAAGLCLAAAAGPRAAESGPFLRIGTGSEAGSEFSVGEVLATALQERLSSEACGLADCSQAPALVVAQLSNGSLANLRDLRDGRLEAAFVEAPVARWGYRGEGAFAEAGPMPGLRAVAALYPVLLQVVVLERSGIERIADLDGRRVSLDARGSGTGPIARRVLAASGLDREDVEARSLEPDIALERLAAGKLDAFFALGGVPMAAVSQANELAHIRLLPVGAEGLDEGATQGEAPQGETTIAETARPAIIAEGSYAGLPAVKTLAFTEQLLVDESLAEDLVYALTARLWAADTQRRLQALRPEGAGLSLERALDGLEVPLHPGAERFYRERGVLP